MLLKSCSFIEKDSSILVDYLIFYWTNLLLKFYSIDSFILFYLILLFYILAKLILFAAVSSFSF